MPTTKTFASGAPLAAADVNEHLVHRVPRVGDVYDTEPQIIRDGAVRVEGRRIGHVVCVRIIINVTGLTGNVIQLESGAPIIPLGMRPPDIMYGAGEGTHPGVGYTPATFKVFPGGGISIIKPTTTSEYLYGSVTYLI